jgi:acetyl/propionyl-CoA carboxylase alpha subunit
MTFAKLLIANRGEIAIRIARAAADLGIRTVAIHSEDDALSLHTRRADEAVALPGRGAAAYLDIAAVIAAAKASGADAVHPGYGFLSENADFATACAEAGLTFVGPRPETLRLFGDKASARAFATRNDVPVPPGTDGPTELAEAKRFLAAQGGAPVMVKAIAGGGGRGMRIVAKPDELDEAFARCRSEAEAAFGSGDLYVERLIGQARHIEVQVIGDRTGTVSHLHERECTLQRRNQKIVEIAPSPSLSPGLRGRIGDAAVLLARAAAYENLGTFEFLVDSERESFFFMEANPRLQVEHTVTEEVLGLDLVQAQIAVASGRTLGDLGLTQDRVPEPRGYAVQLRINLETMDRTGAVMPAGGVLTAFEPPSGPGIRVDHFGYAGYRTSASFDAMIAKVIAHTPSRDYADAVRKAGRALAEFRIEGAGTNIPFLLALLEHPAVRANTIDTRFVEANIGALVDAAQEGDRTAAFFPDAGDGAATVSAKVAAPAGTVAAESPMQATIVTIEVSEGDLVRPGQQLAVLEAMKMEHLVTAQKGGIVRALAASKGETLMPGAPILFIEPADVEAESQSGGDDADPDAIRPDLAEVIERHAIGLDERRPAAVARRRKTGQRTTRENLAQLCDPDSFIEYGPLAVAARRRKHSVPELVEMSPADGVVSGIGTVNAGLFGAASARCMVVAYDYTVMAGTQGQMNHKKQDRMFKLAAEWRLPVVLFAEGGGGRPGDTDRLGLTGLDVPTFGQFASLSGLVPLVGIVSGRCFAGNAALLGCCDVIVATENTSVGMGGPAMIEGGGLGVYTPEEVGPVSFQAPNGVIDILVRDEEEAVEAAKRYLSYFQGAVAEWSAPDQRGLRRRIPENRLRVYDIRSVIEGLADEGSVLELRKAFGVGIVTALVRIEGRPFGLLANNPKHLGGAIDADAADKAARFVQLCDAHGLPILSLCDTPGFMVGPEAEKTALVRHVCRMFVTAASISVPYFTVVLRKGYGLGAQAMAGGGFHASVFTIAWPTGEFGGMGLEGAVRLGFRKEMEAIADPNEREAYFRDKVAGMYANGKAISIASVLEIDEVIDPADTRRWVTSGLNAAPPPARGEARRRPFVDTW